jgi:hypothetical protein
MKLDYPACGGITNGQAVNLLGYQARGIKDGAYDKRVAPVILAGLGVGRRLNNNQQNNDLRDYSK